MTFFQLNYILKHLIFAVDGTRAPHPFRRSQQAHVHGIHHLTHSAAMLANNSHCLGFRLCLGVVLL